MEHPPERVTLSVVIPVYNEAATIATLLARVQAVPFETEIILVDDGSTDGTWDVVQAFADVPNITLVRRARNQGKGAALRDGFARATNDIVIVQDADLEYNPSDYPKLIQPILDDQADVVFGSRFIGGEARRVLYFLARGEESCPDGAQQPVHECRPHRYRNRLQGVSAGGAAADRDRRGSLWRRA